MARNKGTFGAAFNFEVKMQAALDPRVVVDTKSELINKETWPYNGDTIYLYEGLIVAVRADKAMYMLVDITKVLAADYSGWKQLDVSAAQTVEIIDSLDSASTTSALSANQGKVLDGKISDLAAKLASVYSYRGSKETFAELPEDAKAGDVWNVNEAHENHPAGTNWAWTGTEWDALGGTVDLTPYLTKVDADNKYAAKSADGNIQVESGKAVQTEKTDGTKLDLVKGGDAGIVVGDATAPLAMVGSEDRPSYAKGEGASEQLALLKDVTEGDATTLQAAKDYADQKVADIDMSGFVSKEVGKELIPSDKLALIDTNKSDLDEAKADITAAEGKIAVLEGKVANNVTIIPGEKTDSIVTKIGAVTPGADKVDVAVEVVTKDADGSYKHGEADVAVTLPKATTQVAGVMSAADKTALDNVVTKATKVETDLNAEKEKVATLQGDMATAKGDITGLKGRMDTAEGDITTNSEAIAAVKSTADAAAAALVVLNGDENTEGSVKKTATGIAQTVAAAAVEEGLAWIEVTE